MITLRNVALRRGTQLLLQDINWTIFHKQHIGIIGANGAGKSSFFSLLLGTLASDVGEVEIPKQLVFSHVAQETPAENKSALAHVLAGDRELLALEDALKIAEEQNDGEQMAHVHARMGEIDAYSANARAAQLLNGLGFSQQEQQKAVSEFSGGFRMRLNLAQALMCRSDVLLLDEPTNHLDLDAVLWLGDWLTHYQGTLLVISHDRDFLDQVVDHIAHIENQSLKLYTGNYSFFEKQHANNILLQQAAYEKQQKQITHMQQFIDRFRAKASKAKQAQSRLKALDKLEMIQAVHLRSPFQFHFKKPTSCPNPLISLQDAHVSYGDKTILSNLQFNIAPEERIALIGPNGAGKSSLIKLLAGELTAGGERTTGHGLKIGYFAQHQVDHLQANATPLDHLRKYAPTTREQDLRTFLGSFAFSNQRIFEPIEQFSGGEKSRLALALIIWQAPNLLLLDEPTNHLDLEMREALSLALQDYEGAMVIVSHDRFLLRSTVNQLFLVADGHAQLFTGDLEDYESWLFNYRKKTNTANSAVSASRKEAAQQKTRPLMEQLKKLETQLETLKLKHEAIEAELSTETLFLEENKVKLKETLVKQAEIQKKILIIEEEWLNISEKLNS